MKTNELMLSDWVFAYGHPRQVEIIYGERIQADCIELSEGEFEPIPLTPEILEKNGFKIYEQDFTSNIVYEFGSLDYMEFEEFHKYFDIGSKITYEHFGREITYIHPLMRIYFVHELQHALRLCEINKEIIL